MRGRDWYMVRVAFSKAGKTYTLQWQFAVFMFHYCRGTAFTK